MRSLLYSSILICFISGSFAQSGYLGKRNVFGIEGLANSPLLSGSYSKDIYREKGEEMIASKDRFNYGYGAYYLRNINRRYSLGLSFVAKQFLVPTPDNYTTFYTISYTENDLDSSWLRMESIAMNSMAGMFQFEFHTKKGLGPVGFSHQLGIGFSITKPVIKPYSYSINEFGNDASAEELWTPSDRYYFESDWKAYKAITLQYGINMRLPLSDHFAIDLGIKNLINIYLKPTDEILKIADTTPFSYESIFFSAQRKNLITVNLKLGISYLF